MFLFFKELCVTFSHSSPWVPVIKYFFLQLHSLIWTSFSRQTGWNYFIQTNVWLQLERMLEKTTSSQSKLVSVVGVPKYIYLSWSGWWELFCLSLMMSLMKRRRMSMKSVPHITIITVPPFIASAWTVSWPDPWSLCPPPCPASHWPGPGTGWRPLAWLAAPHSWGAGRTGQSNTWGCGASHGPWL